MLTELFLHFLMLSLLSIGGAVSTAPEMHRYLVSEMHWLSESQFAASLALAQAAPGPNVLFVAVLGWTIAGGPGVAVVMTGMLLPSTVLSMWATRWTARNRETRAVRAFASGMAPLTVGLLVATAWTLSGPVRDRPGDLGLVVGTAAVVGLTRAPPIWMVILGAGLGWAGWV